MVNASPFPDRPAAPEGGRSSGDCDTGSRDPKHELAEKKNCSRPASVRPKPRPRAPNARPAAHSDARVRLRRSSPPHREWPRVRRGASARPFHDGRPAPVGPIARVSRNSWTRLSTTNRRASHEEPEPTRHRAHPRAHPRAHRVARGRRRCHPRTVDAPPAAAAARTYRRDTIHDARLTDNAPRGTVDDTYECTGRGASGAG